LQEKALEYRVRKGSVCRMPLDHHADVDTVNGKDKRNSTNVLALATSGERYVFLYDTESREKMCELLQKYADNPDLSLTQEDADKLIQAVKMRLGNALENE